MRKDKAAGIDMISGEVYKLMEKEKNPTSNSAKTLLSLLNNVFIGKEFPEE